MMIGEFHACFAPRGEHQCRDHVQVNVSGKEDAMTIVTTFGNSIVGEDGEGT